MMIDRSKNSAASVSDITGAIATLLREGIGYVRVAGELSGFRRLDRGIAISHLRMSLPKLIA